MPISVPALRALVAAGVSAGAIVDAVEAAIAEDKARAIEEAEAEREELKRTRGLEAKRQQRKRARDKLPSGPLFQSHVPASVPASSVPASAEDDPSRVTRDVTRDSASPHPPPGPSPLPPGGGEGGGARATCEISQQAFALADQVMAIVGIDRQFTPPGWCGLPMYLQGGLNDGWRADVVLLAVQRVVAGLRQRNAETPHTFGYFTKPIIREHQNQQRPFPIVGAVGQPDVAHAQATQHQPGGSYGARKDAGAAAHLELRARIAQSREAEDRGGGGQVVELLPAARRG